MFPELLQRLKEFRADKGELLALNLKSAEGQTFTTTTEMEFYRKYPSIYAALSGGMPTSSGISVTRETALSHSAMWACYCLICESVAGLPADVKIKTGNAKRDATEHPMYSAMKDAPNAEMPFQVFSELLTGHSMLEGDGFAQIVRRSGTDVALELRPLMPWQVRTDRETQGQRRKVHIVCQDPSGPEKTYTMQPGKPHEIFQLQNIGNDGLHGYSLLAIGREVIGTALAAERHVGSFWAGGGRKPFWLERMTKFATDEQFKEWRANFNKVYGDPRNNYVSEDGTKLHEIGTSMVESQALESRRHAVTDFCRLTGATPHLVAHLTDSNYSITEQLFLEFKTITLRKWTKRWEQAFNFYVLTQAERDKGYFLKINLDAFLQADFKSRMDGYASALQNGHMNRDEVRDLEDRNPLPDGAGEAYTIQLNMQTLPDTGKPLTSELRLRQATPPATAKEPGPTPMPTPKAIAPPTNGVSPKAQVKTAIDKILTALKN